VPGLGWVKISYFLLGVMCLVEEMQYISLQSPS
jgi:hypothetical protein